MTYGPICITGMHRSGTSLVASLIQAAGVNIGDRLISPNKSNPHGHFEDVDFNLFQRNVLQRFGQSYLVQDAAALGELTAQEIDRARSLIDRRRREPMWGWKDPRTALFLDAWHGLLKSPRYIFIYRHPIEVVLSLLRRAEAYDVDVLSDPLKGLRAWQLYNQSILDFYQKHPDICLLCHISGITADVELFIERAARKLDLLLNTDGVAHRYHYEDLHQMHFPPPIEIWLRQIASGPFELYTQLEAIADLPSRLSQQTMLVPTAVEIRTGRLSAELDASAQFTLLLTLLNPQTVLSGKARLDALRLKRIGWLERHCQSKGQRITQLMTYMLRSPLVSQLVTKYIWPCAHRFIPTGVRLWLKQVLLPQN